VKSKNTNYPDFLSVLQSTSSESVGLTKGKFQATCAHPKVLPTIAFLVKAVRFQKNKTVDLRTTAYQ